MTDKKTIDQDGMNSTVQKSDDPPPAPPVGNEPDTKSALYMSTAIGASAAWLISPHVKELHQIIWWILPAIFLLIGFFGWYKFRNKD
jgi:hypothetical protein